MLDLITAERIVKAVNTGDGNHKGVIVTIDEVIKMREIEKNNENSVTVYGLQKGDVTILVRLYDTITKIPIPNVRFICW